MPLPLRSEYLLLIDDTLIIDACGLRKEALEKEYRVEVLSSAEQLTKPFRCCGLGCLMEGTSWRR